MQVVTVSTDLPEEIRESRGTHGLKARMLSDRDLAVTDAFGLRNQGIHSGPVVALIDLVDEGSGLAADCPPLAVGGRLQ